MRKGVCVYLKHQISEKNESLATLSLRPSTENHPRIIALCTYVCVDVCLNERRKKSMFMARGMFLFISHPW